VVNHMNTEVTPLIDALESSVQTMPALAPLVHSLRAGVDKMMMFNPEQTYRNAIKNSIFRVIEMQSTLSKMRSGMSNIIDQYVQSTNGLVKSVNNVVYNNSYVNYAQDMINKAKTVELSPPVRQFNIPEPWNSAVTEVGVAGLNRAMEYTVPTSAVDTTLLEPVYQAAISAWDVNQSLQQNLQNTLSHLLNMAQEELDDVSALPKALSPVTVNQQGEVQAELALPLEMQSLQSLPDASPLVARGERMLLKIADNLPTRQQLDSLVQSVSNLFPQKEEVKEQAVEQLKKFKPSKKFKGKKGGKKLAKKLKQLKQ